MPDFAANLSTMFTELPFLARFGAAARCGFDAVELAFPYAFSKEELAGRLREHGLTLVAFNLPAGAWEEGERGIACDPGRTAEFRQGHELPVRQLPRRRPGQWRQRRSDAPDSH
jgi:hydroxypyruvate isomerase